MDGRLIAQVVTRLSLQAPSPSSVLRCRSLLCCLLPGPLLSLSLSLTSSAVRSYGWAPSQHPCLGSCRSPVPFLILAHGLSCHPFRAHVPLLVQRGFPKRSVAVACFTPPRRAPLARPGFRLLLGQVTATCLIHGIQGTGKKDGARQFFQKELQTGHGARRCT